MTVTTVAPTPAARRMRDARSRKAEGFRVVPLEVHDREIAALVVAGWLTEAERGDREAIARAMGAMLDHVRTASGDAVTFPARPR